MDAPEPGHFWKTPFIWEGGDPLPAASDALRFEPVPDHWISTSLGQVMATSLDESDQYAVARFGSDQAVADLLAILPQHFVRPEGWWRAVVDSQDQRVGFVLPVLFKDPARFKDGRPQGTIFHMGVLPKYRGRGFALHLIEEATRIFIRANCWRIFCDTASVNHPMINAFRKAGYKERAAWQRPVA